MGAEALVLDNRSTKKSVIKNLKTIKGNKIRTQDLIEALASKLEERYTVTRFNTAEISIKGERKSNYEEVYRDTKAELDELVQPHGVSLQYLFRITKLKGGVYVTARR